MKLHIIDNCLYNPLDAKFFCIWFIVCSLWSLVSLPSSDCAETVKQTNSYYDPHDIFYLMDEQLITIASKREEKVKDAPSIVTIITEKEIENMGARTISDILMTVPGFDILKSAFIGISDINVRGISSTNANRELKLLIDGHSINDPGTGSVTFFFDDLPLRNVKRIEIIRGPGSAIYGANAFLGIINVITKDSDDIDGVEVSTRFESYDTQDYSIMFGKTLYGIDIAGFANFYNTNGLLATQSKRTHFHLSRFLIAFLLPPAILMIVEINLISL